MLFLIRNKLTEPKLNLSHLCSKMNLPGQKLTAEQISPMLAHHCDALLLLDGLAAYKDYLAKVPKAPNPCKLLIFNAQEDIADCLVPIWRPELAGIVAGAELDKLEEALHAIVLEQQLWIPRQLVSHLITRTKEDRRMQRSGLMQLMTEREMQVLKLAFLGISNERIAKQLEISINTVKSHMHHAYKKLGVKNKLQAQIKVDVMTQLKRLH